MRDVKTPEVGSVAMLAGATAPRPPRWLGVIAALVGRAPFAKLRAIGVVLAFIAFDLLRVRRRHALLALRRAGVARPVACAREAYRRLGTGLAELLWIAAHPEASIEPLVTLDGAPIFDEAAALGRGVIVATAHTGNWDLAACALARHASLVVVSKRLSARGLDAFWQSTRAARGLEILVPDRRGIFEAVRARLVAGRNVALLIDQDPERRHAVVRRAFLGAEALHDRMPAMLAARTGAPIVLALPTREGRAHRVKVVARFVPPDDADGRWIDETTAALADALDAHVRARPEDWLWLHRRWKSAAPDGSPRARESEPTSGDDQGAPPAPM
jgi:KDO2-lipid IV(A) lauroyltransferase